MGRRNVLSVLRRLTYGDPVEENVTKTEDGATAQLNARTRRWPIMDVAVTAAITAFAVAAMGSVWKQAEDEKVWKADCAIAEEALSGEERLFTDVRLDLADVQGPMNWGNAAESAELQSISDRIDDAIARGEELANADLACEDSNSAAQMREQAAELEAVSTEIGAARAEFVMGYQQFDTDRAATAYNEASGRFLDAVLRAEDLHGETSTHPDQALREHFARKIERARNLLAEPMEYSGAQLLYSRATDLNARAYDLAITAVDLTDDPYWGELRDEIDAL